MPTHSKAAMFFDLGLAFSLLLPISMVEGRHVLELKTSQAVEDCKTPYQVQDGDTCYAIWQKFNLFPQVFYGINPNIVCDKLVIGQQLCIDDGSVSPLAPAPQRSLSSGAKKPNCRDVYEVQSGDTCYAIWLKFHLMREKFEKNNPSVVCDLLQIGQKLCIDRKI